MAGSRPMKILCKKSRWCMLGLLSASLLPGACESSGPRLPRLKTHPPIALSGVESAREFASSVPEEDEAPVPEEPAGAPGGSLERITGIRAGSRWADVGRIPPPAD
jgi:hypothetical protein